MLTPDRRGPAPVVAALRVIRGKGDKQETAFIPATGPVGHARDGRRQPRQGLHALPGGPGPAAAKVKVTASAGSGGGTAASEDVHGQGRHHPERRAARPERPQGHLRPDGRAAVRAVPSTRRACSKRPQGGVPMFTVQTAAGRPGHGGGAGRGPGPLGAAEVTRRAATPGRRRAAQSSPYRGSTVSGVSPSSSATCSTTTSCTSAARSSRPLVRISTGRR